MQVFKTQRNLYVKNEIIYWASWFGVILVLFLINLSISFFSNATLIGAIAFLLFSMGIDVIKKYHVEQININQLDKTVTIFLKSQLSGKKQLTFSLDKVSSDFEVKINK